MMATTSANDLTERLDRLTKENCGEVASRALPVQAWQVRELATALFPDWRQYGAISPQRVPLVFLHQLSTGWQDVMHRAGLSEEELHRTVVAGGTYSAERVDLGDVLHPSTWVEEIARSRTGDGTTIRCRTEATDARGAFAAMVHIDLLVMHGSGQAPSPDAPWRWEVEEGLLNEVRAPLEPNGSGEPAQAEAVLLPVSPIQVSRFAAATGDYHAPTIDHILARAAGWNAAVVPPALLVGMVEDTLVRRLGVGIGSEVSFEAPAVSYPGERLTASITHDESLATVQVSRQSDDSAVLNARFELSPPSP